MKNITHTQNIVCDMQCLNNPLREPPASPRRLPIVRLDMQTFIRGGSLDFHTGAHCFL